jgi:hypothetical protein
MKRNISDIRTAIFDRDGNKCYYCKTHGPNVELHLDHVLPKSKYNLHNLYNLITACKECNFNKSNHILSDTQYNKILKYLHETNKIFPKETIKTFSIRLTEYYTHKKKLKPKPKSILELLGSPVLISPFDPYPYTYTQIRDNENFTAYLKANPLL